jgi:hypothetical protein
MAGAYLDKAGVIMRKDTVAEEGSPQKLRLTARTAVNAAPQ